MSTAVLEAIDVSYRYGSSSGFVFRNLNLSFEAGRIHALLGKSGSGKTTLLSLDVCLEGEILYCGTDLKKRNQDLYRAEKVGVVFQQFNLLHKYNAVENVMISMEISKFKTANNKLYAKELLNKLGISGISGGEQQRVAIVQFIVLNGTTYKVLLRRCLTPKTIYFVHFSMIVFTTFACCQFRLD